MKPLYFSGQAFLPGQALALATANLESTLISEHERAFWQLIQNWFNPACRWFTLQTSGSTGQPKTISFPREAVILAAESQLKALSNLTIKAAWLALPANKAGGMMLVVRALLAGWDIRLLPNKLNPLETVDETIQFSEYAIISLLPNQFEKILQQPTSSDVLKQASLMLLGGGAVSQSVKELAQSWNYGEIWHTYGMTETLSFVALRNLKEGSALFRPLPDYQAVRQENGCLAIRFPETWASVLDDVWVFTQDVVEISESNLFSVLGRIDEVINSGGLKLFPSTLEAELTTLIGDMPYKVCVVSMDDPQWGQRPCWVFEASMPDADLLASWSDSVHAHHRPAAWTVIESFPFNEGGKLDRRKIKQCIKSA